MIDSNRIWDKMADYYEENEPSFKFLMGQVMKETKGTANPKIARRILAKQIYKHD